MSSDAKRIHYLDGWRGLAILGVLTDHFISARVINFGRFGVEMFFVLSGMLMAEILFFRRTNLKAFMLRRFSRTYPALFVAVVCIFLFARATHLFRFDFPTFLSCITSTYNYFSIYAHHNKFVDNLWSLCIEEHTYLMLMVIAFGQRTWGANPFAIIVALICIFCANGIIQTAYLHREYFQVYWRTDVRAASILIGTATALYFKDNIKVRQDFPVYLLLLGVALNIDRVPDEIKYTIGTLAIALGLVTLRKAPAALLKFLASKQLTAIGMISYSVYLWQQPFAQVSAHSKLVMHAEKMLFLVVIFIIGYLSYRFIENPARDYLNKLWNTQSKSVRLVDTPLETSLETNG
jgi:peptidoglycan/LPS O-acetylase OafA/YrhL